MCCMSCSQPAEFMIGSQTRTGSMSVDLSRAKELEGLENASGQVDAQLETDGSQIELSGLFRVNSHSKLLAPVGRVL